MYVCVYVCVCVGVCVCVCEHLFKILGAASLDCMLNAEGLVGRGAEWDMVTNSQKTSI